jgi:hypothetical protein
MTSNAVPPSVTPPSPDEWPQDLVKTITNITRDSQATVTVTDHGFDSLSEGVTFVCFKQVQGMIQINGLDALIQKVIDTDTFTVNINTTGFYDYRGGGVIIVDSGLPPIQQSGFQYFNTPFQNVANQN